MTLAISFHLFILFTLLWRNGAVNVTIDVSCTRPQIDNVTLPITNNVTLPIHPKVTTGQNAVCYNVASELI